MQKLHLYIGEKLQGKFISQNLNLLLVFQVNCPGCFIYALPLYRQLYEKYSKKLGFLAISTAFEDFELNTTPNTRLLLKNGGLIGETKKALARQSIEKFPLSIDFPLVMDAKMAHLDKEILVENICLLNPNFQILTDSEKNMMKQQVENYLDKQKEISMTFTANQFRGTPTFVLFNDKSEILSSWFGHIPLEVIAEEIESFIN